MTRFSNKLFILALTLTAGCAGSDGLEDASQNTESELTAASMHDQRRPLKLKRLKKSCQNTVSMSEVYANGWNGGMPEYCVTVCEMTPASKTCLAGSKVEFCLPGPTDSNWTPNFELDNVGNGCFEVSSGAAELGSVCACEDDGPASLKPTSCNSSIELVQLSEQCALVYEETDNASYPIEEICLDEAPISFSLQQFGDGCMTLVAETGSPYGPDMYGPFCPEQCPTMEPIVVGCQDGDTQAADDGCNSCVCKKGQWACTMMLCPDDSDEDDNSSGPPVDCNGNNVADWWKLGVYGDGNCNDGDWPNFNCAEWDWDGGDCADTSGGA